MRSFNKLANLHSVFFKKAADPTQGAPAADKYRKGPLTPFAGALGIPSEYTQDQVRRQLGIASAAGGAGKMISHMAGRGISGIPGGMAAAIPNVMAAGSAFKPDMPGLARKALNAPKPPQPVHLIAPNPLPEDHPIDRIGRNRNFDYRGGSSATFGGGNAPVPNKLGRP